MVREKEVVTAGDRLPELPMPLRPVAFAPAQHVESFSQAGQEQFRTERSQPRGRQFERERQTVQPSADLGNGGRVGLAEREGGVRASGSLYEERDGIGPRKPFRADAGVRQLQRRYRQRLLAAEP